MKETILFCTSEKYQQILNKFYSEREMGRTLMINEPVTGTHNSILHILNSNTASGVKKIVHTAFQQYNCKITLSTNDLDNGQKHILIEVDLNSFPRDVCKKIVSFSRKVHKEETKKIKT